MQLYAAETISSADVRINARSFEKYGLLVWRLVLVFVTMAGLHTGHLHVGSDV